MNMIRVNGDPMAWRDGLTVRGIILARNFKFPLLIVSINDELVEKADYETTQVPDGADVKVIHLISGG